MISRIFITFRKIFKTKMFEKNSQIGANFSASHDSYCTSKNKNNIVIGDNCEICGRLYSIQDGKITIGDYTTIRYASKLSAVQNIIIGNCVIISNNVNIYDHNSHPTDPAKRMEMSYSGFHGDLWSPVHSEQAPVFIQDNVWIGEHVTILKGVTIGKGSIVASHSVVTKSAPPYVIIAGNPARVVKKLSGYGEEL